MKYIKTLTLLSILILSTGCIQKQDQATVITGGAPHVPNVYNPNASTTTGSSNPVLVANPADVETYPPYTPTRSQYLQGAYRGNSKLQQFITTMASKHNYDKYQLNAIFSTVSRDTEALTKIGAFATSKPTQSKAFVPGTWDKYRANFLTDSRIEKGVNFWREHQYYLNEAARRYGVAPEYIVGIIGVETNFGGFTGKHSVLDALTSIALEFPKRSTFFTSELENYLLLVREQQIDPQYIKGSYAGAFGLAQFMPSSFRDYAVDLDGNGQTNLFTAPDAIGSVANYFKEKGKWNNQIPVAMPTYYNKARFYGLATGFKTSYTQQHLYSLGMRPSSNFYGYKGEVSLILLNRYTRDELWWGTPNFYSIARYNPQDHYAMAVHQLAQAIRLAYYKR
ncbi:lytic murein transglycosylase B [bacterium]|nr:lytic murein transglycosylase B [bacterium]MBU1957194.1 lytic murein transglycosylase B [bacterium]